MTGITKIFMYDIRGHYKCCMMPYDAILRHHTQITCQISMNNYCCKETPKSAAILRFLQQESLGDRGREKLPVT